MMNEDRPPPSDIAQVLRAHGLAPTLQRLEIARVVFSRRRHLSAEQILAEVNASGRSSSKATVYNTLKALLRAGLVREVIVDPSRVFFDPNVSPHHHFYDTDRGELMDIEADAIRVDGLPEPPAGMVQDGIDIVIRVRRP